MGDKVPHRRQLVPARPAQAVVDADCRWFGRPNLFVVDGSILPTSMGVGPSLTIIANALRVARVALSY